MALSADGTTAVIGALGVNSNVGAAYVFHVSGEGSWATSSTPTAILTNSGGASGSDFGVSVALSADGTTALIGANGVNSAAGAAYVFHVSGEGSSASYWAPTATLTNSSRAWVPNSVSRWRCRLSGPPRSSGPLATRSLVRPTCSTSRARDRGPRLRPRRPP